MPGEFPSTDKTKREKLDCSWLALTRFHVTFFYFRSKNVFLCTMKDYGNPSHMGDMLASRKLCNTVALNLTDLLQMRQELASKHEMFILKYYELRIWSIIRSNSALKSCKTTRPLLYISLSHGLTLSQMFSAMFKPREIDKFTQGYDAFHVFSPLCDVKFD